MRHPVREAGGTTAHVRAFEAIAVNKRPRCRQATLDWLVDHGMITKGERYVGLDDFGPVMICNYEATYAYQRPWCEWYAGQTETTDYGRRHWPTTKSEPRS